MKLKHGTTAALLGVLVNGLAFAQAPATGPATQPTAAEVAEAFKKLNPEAAERLARIPILDAKATDAEPFSFRWFMAVNGTHVGVLASAPGDGRADVIVYDPNDGLPILICVDGHIYVYDVPQRRITIVDNVAGQAIVAGDGSALHLTFGWVRGQANEEQTIFLDLASVALPARARRMDQSQHTVVHIEVFFEEQKRVRFDFDRPTDAIPSHVSIYDDESTRFFQVDNIRRGEAIETLKALDIDGLRKAMPVTDLKMRQDREEVKADLTAVLGSMMLRMAVREPAVRQSMVRQFPDVNWEEVADNEAYLSAAWLAELKRQGFLVPEPVDIDAWAKEP